MNRRKSANSKTGLLQSRNVRRLLAIVTLVTAVLTCMETAVDLAQKLVNLFAS